MWFTAIVPEAYPGEAKMSLRLIAETDARFVGEPSFLFSFCELYASGSASSQALCIGPVAIYALDNIAIGSTIACETMLRGVKYRKLLTVVVLWLFYHVVGVCICLLETVNWLARLHVSVDPPLRLISWYFCIFQSAIQYGAVSRGLIFSQMSS